MSAYKSDFLNVLASRGFIHQVSEPEALDARAARGAITAYIGFDCTAPSLHVGSLLPIMMLRLAAADRPSADRADGRRHHARRRSFRQGREPQDPHRRGDRRAISPASARSSRNSSNSAMSRSDAIMANNADWLNSLNYIDFLRDVGRHFSVNRMLAFDSVKLRLDRQQELSFLEFNYMILQAYDFVELHKRHGCMLQMGGSDQWGNIVNGIDLGRRMLNAQLFALTSPLITTSSGAKMGKTAAGAVWLDADMLSPYDYWQYWRNTEDGDVARFLKLFTDAAARRDRPACRAQGPGDQRSQEGARDRSDRPGARPRRRRRRPPRPRGGRSRKARSRKRCRPSRSPRASWSPGSACWPPSSKPASSPRTARRAARSRAAASRSTTPPSTDEKMMLTPARSDAGRRDQAFARPQAARAAQAAVAAEPLERARPV